MERKNDEGFTLVELLIIIVILVILATITVFTVRGITEKDQSAACAADQQALQSGVDTWFAQYGGDAIPGDVTTTNNNGDVTDMEPEAALVEAGFLAAESTDFIVSKTGGLTPVAADAGGTCDV